MNILKTNFFIKKGKNVIIRNNNDYLFIENTGDNIETIIIPKIYRYEKQLLNIDFYGEVLEGEGIVAKIINRKRQVVSELQFQSKYYIKRPTKFGMIALRIQPKTKVKITKFTVEEVDEYQEKLKDFTKNKILVMSPRLSI